MRHAITGVISAAALCAWAATVNGADTLSPQVRVQLCSEKKAGLAELEAEAPALHAQVAKLQSEYDAALAAVSKLLTGATDRVTTPSGGYLNLGLDAATLKALDVARASADNIKKQLDSSRERETYVGSQIFLLRDIIEGLGCDALTPAKPQPPPIDYGAIDQLNQQFQQSQPGGQTTTSNQSVQPQSSSYTAPTPGYGTPGVATQQPPGSGGYYGYSPSDETPSVQTPWDSLVPPTTWGGGSQPKNPCGGG